MKANTSAVSSRISVSSVKTFRGMEGYGVNCVISVDGKKIARYIDDASGGPGWFEPLTVENGFKILDELRAQLPKEKYGDPLETVICGLLDEYEVRRSFERKIKDCVMYTRPDKKGIWSTKKFTPDQLRLCLAKMRDTSGSADSLRVKWNVKECLNLLDPEAAYKIYASNVQ